MKKSLQIDENKAFDLYQTATPEFKQMLEDSFGKEFSNANHRPGKELRRRLRYPRYRPAYLHAGHIRLSERRPKILRRFPQARSYHPRTQRRLAA